MSSGRTTELAAPPWGLTDVVVRFGTRTALDRLSVQLQPGVITSVVGGDGAGKTTTLRLASGLLVPDEGTVHHPPRHRIGAALEIPGVYRDLTVDENLRFAATAYGLTAEERERRAGELLERAGLATARHRLASQLSGGMRQKLAVVAALLHQPDLLVLDEPTTGVDPVSRAELWRLIGHAAARGAAVLLTTSYLDEAERAGHIVVLADGYPLLQGAPDELTRGGSATLERVVVEAQRAVGHRAGVS